MSRIDDEKSRIDRDGQNDDLLQHSCDTMRRCNDRLNDRSIFGEENNTKCMVDDYSQSIDPSFMISLSLCERIRGVYRCRLDWMRH